MGFWAAALPALGVGASSALGWLSGKQQNEAADNRARASMEFESGEATRAMEFSSAQAKAQMDFQERMSGSAHQREVDDLRSAGLNPLLSINAGASSPAGASGESSMGSGSQGPVVPELGAIASSARDAIGLYTQFKTADANVGLARAQTKKAGVETDILKDNSEERHFKSKLWRFLNGLMDRYGENSAKSNNIPWFGTDGSGRTGRVDENTPFNIQR